MDDHAEALPFWRQGGRQGLTCVHLDAHLDVQEEGIPLASSTGAALHREGVHCGNFLAPALREGLITRLLWVVPPALISGPHRLRSTLQHLLSWVDLTLEEYSSFVLEGGRVSGLLWGRRLEVCPLEALPELTTTEGLVLDVDVDYFVTLEDELWQSPEHLQILAGHPWEALTVATSLEGGYTPHSFWHLALEVFEALGQPTPRACAPPPSAADEACRAFWKGQPQVAEEKLQQANLDPMERSYFLAVLRIHLQHWEAAWESLQELSPHPFPQYWWMRAQVQANRNQPRDCLRALATCLEFFPNWAPGWAMQGRQWRALGDYQRALRSLRKALRLCQGRISSLELLLELARWYDEAGQAALARSTRRSLRQLDVTGTLAIESLLDRVGS